MSPPTDVLRALVQAGTELASTASLEATLRVTVESAVRLVGAPYGALMLLGQDAGVTQFCATEQDGGLVGVPTPEEALDVVLAEYAAGRLTCRRAGGAAPARLPLLGGVVRLHGELLGIIYLAGKDGGFVDEDETLLQSLVQPAALTIGNACLHWRAEERAEKLRILGRLTELVTSSADSRTVFTAVAQAATTLLGARMTRVWIDDPVGRVLRIWASFGVDPVLEAAATDYPVLPRGEGVIGAILRTRAPEYVVDVRRDPRWRNRRLLLEADLHAFAGLPLIVEDRVLGVLSILFGPRPLFRAEEKELMALLAGQAALAVRNAQLLEEAERRREEAALTAAVARTLNAPPRLDEVLRQVAEAARMLCRADGARIALREPGSETLVYRYASGLTREIGAAGREPGDPSTLLDLTRPAADTPCTVVVPIWIEGTVEGLIRVENRTARPFSDGDKAVLVRLAEQIGLAIRNAQGFQEAARRSRIAQALAEVGGLAARAPDLQALGQSITDWVRALLDIRSAALYRLEPDSRRLTRLAMSGTLVHLADPGDREAPPWIRRALDERRPVVTSDARAGGDRRDGPALQEPDRALLCVPLQVGPRVLGALCAEDLAGRVFAIEEIRLVQTFANQAALAFENARLHAAVGRRKAAGPRARRFTSAGHERKRSDRLT